jgi:L-ascorbate metabolism protein UlaG (beta-lactamase superfamily)
MNPFSKNPYYKGPKTNHFDGKRFFNPLKDPMPSFFDVIKWKLTSKPAKWPKHIKHPHFDSIDLSVGSHSVEITYIGHSSFLINIAGLNILIDPIYSTYAGPLKTENLRRRIDPGIAKDQLPKIDIVLISHSHYDHCDMNFLKFISKRDQPHFITPLGLDQLLKKEGISGSFTSLDWFESIKLPSVEIYVTPAKHWSQRHLFDKNLTLWGGFFIKSATTSVYYVGDSGYDEMLFKQISSYFPSFDVAIIPIGAYKPRWFMKFAHMDPYEACLVHKQILAKYSLAAHHRTFPLADEGPFDSEEDLKIGLKQTQIHENAFLYPLEGQKISF